MDFSRHFYGGFYGNEITFVEYYQDTAQFGSNISLLKTAEDTFWLVTNIL
jgi:hypothetical protein